MDGDTASKGDTDAGASERSTSVTTLDTSSEPVATVAATAADSMSLPVSDAYSTWATEVLGVRLGYKVEVQSLPPPVGRGIVATEYIPANKEILSVPYSALLTSESLRDTKVRRPLLLLSTTHKPVSDAMGTDT